MDASNFALKIAAKSLQIATWLVLTTYRNSLSPHPMVPSPISYDVPLSHNTDNRNRQTDDILRHRHER